MSKNSISEKKYTSVHRTGLCTVSELFSTACTRSSRTSYRYWIVPRSAYCSSDRRIFSISYIYRRQPQGRKARELALIGVSLACRAEGQSAHVLFVRTVTEAWNDRPSRLLRQGLLSLGSSWSIAFVIEQPSPFKSGRGMQGQSSMVAMPSLWMQLKKSKWPLFRVPDTAAASLSYLFLPPPPNPLQ
jgi:hypothetical protein